MNTQQNIISEEKTVDLAECVLLGKLVGVWGVKGWLKVFSYTRPRQDIGQYKQWLLVTPAPAPLRKKKSQSATAESKKVVAKVATVKKCKVQGQNIVATLADVQYRDQAEAIVGLEVYIEKSQLKPLPEGEFYWSDMLNCQVVNEQGEDFGTVDSMLETGANDVLVVHAEENGAKVERLIPYSPEIVLSLDINEKKIVVDWEADFLVTETGAETESENEDKSKKPS